MLFSNSPVKNIVEKLNPFSQKNKISRLKFERKGDYKTFLKFIKDSTKEIEDIKIPESEDKKRKGLMIGGGLLGLGLLGFAARGKRDSDDGTGKLQSISGVIQKAKADSKKAISGTKTRSNLDTASDVIKLNRKRRVINKVYSDNIPKKVDVSKLNTDKIFDAVKNEKKTKLSKQEQEELKKKARRNNKSTTVTDVDGNTTKIKKSSTATIDNNQGKQGPTGGTRNRIRGGNQNQMPEGYSPLSETDKMADRAQQYKQTLDDIEKVEKQLERARMPKTKERLTERLNVLRKRLEDLSPKSTVKPNILQRFMNFYNQGRTPAEDTMPFFGKKGLIADDFSKITRTDKAYKDGATGLKGARPFKAFTPRMLKTGPTPLTRQLIERPFRSLFGTGSNMLKSVRKDYAKALFKSKTKSGLFFVDVFFAGQSFYDLFARPGDNILVTIRDFSTAVNNAVNRNDPEKLRYFVRRSRKSSPLFGVSNDAIRQFEINRNLEIKKLKEEAAAAKTSVIREESSNRNVIITPQNNNAKRGSGVRNRTTGGKKISFLPMDLKNPFADQIEYKLSK